MKRPQPKARLWPAAAAVGIIVAGALIVWAFRPADPPADPVQTAESELEAIDAGPAVAMVRGEPIYLSEVRREAAAQGLIAPADRIAPGDAAFDRVLDELIDQTLLAQEALSRGLDDTPEARRRLETARERILGNVLVEAEVAGAVTDETIARMYEEQVRLVEMGDEVRVRHILVDTREEAEALKERAEAGEDFFTLAFDNSTDEATRLEGGDLGYVTSDSLVGPLAVAAYATPVGQISSPVETEFGWHIVQVTDRRAQLQPDLEELRPRIVRFMTFDTIQRLLADLRDGADIEMLELTPAEIDAEGDGGPMADFLEAMPSGAPASAARMEDPGDEIVTGAGPAPDLRRDSDPGSAPAPAADPDAGAQP